MGSIYSHIKFLQVPPGTYKLEFGDVYWEGIEVASSETKQILVGTIEVPHLEGSLIEVYEQQSGKKMGSIYSHIKFLQVPPGIYKLQAGNLFTLEDITVEAGQAVVIEQ